MDIIGSILLVVIILLALNHMAGGKPDSVLRPVAGVVRSIVGLAFKLIGSVFSFVFSTLGNLIGGSLKSLPPPGNMKDQGGVNRPKPPRW